MTQIRDKWLQENAKKLQYITLPPEQRTAALATCVEIRQFLNNFVVVTAQRSMRSTLIDMMGAAEEAGRR